MSVNPYLPNHEPTQDPTWLAAKNAFHVRSGVTANTPKGAHTHPYIISASAAPVPLLDSSSELPTSDVQVVYEPGDGNGQAGHYNFGPHSTALDDGGHPYYDLDFVDLCGPGAADVALFYWPYPSNYYTNNSVTDTAHTSTTTKWGSERMRGYMTYVAWQTQIPGYSHPGMMDNTHYPTYATTLYGLRDGLNWEASGHGAGGNWSTYFYVIEWHDTGTQATLLNDVEVDVDLNGVPVVAEVDARMMPNWNPGSLTRHFITIIGYDNNRGIYYYTDTCGSSSGCGSNHDAGIQIAPQSTLWNAVYAVPINKSTAPNAGDGGWVW